MIALDIDGVALHDTFSPVIYLLVKKWGGEYSREIERNVFSQTRNKAASYLIETFNLNMSTDELIKLYFNERALYLKENEHGPIEGLQDFLNRLREMQLKIICYGGLDKKHFDKEMGNYEEYFDGEKYICTNDFRPGVKEIVSDIYALPFENVLFIDDVNRVAEEAKKRNSPFVGVPSHFQYGFQKEDMIKTGVKYIVESIRDIDYSLLNSIDSDVSSGRIWSQ